MYISPDTTVVLLRDCPLDNTYDHTIYFSNATDQYNYFYSLRKYTLLDQAYTRVKRGYINVDKKSDDLYDCNYMMFQNKAYGNKWFYAFIKSVEYVNNEVCRVEFEIDEMQTWHFDYQLKECFVEREHSATDVIGENLVPEGLEQGEYVQNGGAVNLLEGMIPSKKSILVVTTFNNDDALSISHGRYIGGVYSGLNVIEFTSESEVNSFLTRVVEKNKLDGVIGVYMSPVTIGSVPADNPSSSVSVFEKHYSSLDGYKPRNKKLYTYPYNLLHVATDTGSSDFRYEFFTAPSENVCSFKVLITPIPTPTFIVAPIGYMGEDDANMEYRIPVTDYPQCAWVNDTYAAWYAQNTGALYAKAASTAVNTVGGVAAAAITGNPIAAVGSVVSAVDTIFNTVGQRYDISTKAPQSNGAQSNMADFSCGAKKAMAKAYTIRREFAQIIDDFFDMFGYATHRVKVPNRNVRPHWTYVKTRTCVAVGGVPSDSMSKIISIYNNGITFWKKGSEVGNYSLDNRV